MRGKLDPQAVLFTAAVDLNQRVRSDHPLRAIKRMADADLARLSGRFDAAYTAHQGRPSVPPERLIKALLLQSIYSIRSEAQLIERIDHDLLFRWFLDMPLDQTVFDATVFSHNRKRLEDHGLIGAFFDSTVRRAMDAGLISTEHFSIDGSLIEAYASVKSFVPKEPTQNAKDKNDPPNSGFKSRNASVDFTGQKRSNATHQSTTDPEARLFCKSYGDFPRLRHGLHAITENRHGLVLAVEVNSPLDNSEPRTAISLIDRIKKRFKIKPKTTGADKGYDQAQFLRKLERRKIRPHVAVREGRVGGSHPAYRKKHQADIRVRMRMKRRMATIGYQISQRCRKKIEELFGWVKTIGGLARTRLIGHWKTGQQAHLTAAAFNLIRLRKLCG